MRVPRYDRVMIEDLRAKVFRDRINRDGWLVEKLDEDGGYECVEVFAGPNARQRALDYARHRFGEFDEISTWPETRHSLRWGRLSRLLG